MERRERAGEPERTRAIETASGRCIGRERALARAAKYPHCLICSPIYSNGVKFNKAAEWHRATRHRISHRARALAPAFSSPPPPLEPCYPSSSLLKRHQIPFGHQLIKCFCQRCKFLPAGKMRRDRTCLSRSFARWLSRSRICDYMCVPVLKKFAI